MFRACCVMLGSRTLNDDNNNNNLLFVSTPFLLRTIHKVANRVILTNVSTPIPFDSTSSRLLVSPWYRSCIPHGDACTEINCSGPLPSSLNDAEVIFLCQEQKQKRLGHEASPLLGPALWNNLPDDLRNPFLSLPVFKQSLKSYLFKQC